MEFLTEKEIIDRINVLRKQKNAIIITHNYQLGEVQDIADFTGDSLELSMKAADTKADVIVFCGVKFMAETAAILSPDKTVLLPVMESGCPMADMADAEDLIKMKKEHPDALVVTYVNSSAEVKALTDVCVTSANALKIVSALPPDKEIIFVPDKNLGAYVQRKTGRKMILWPGFCPTHMRITPQIIIQKKKEYPDAKVMIHPEARLDVLDLADEVLSTGGMCKFAKQTDAKKIIVATEIGLIYRLRKENPDKMFIPVTEQAVCPNMKMHRIENVLESLEKLEHRISVPEEIRVPAEKSIRKMLEMSR
ncbi:MAG TPA: quinolinate synthase [Lentisphaeria bacterium]|nr:MAG: quinolinate synthase [Lentisphaerae bacterium GWF2_49_21]HBC87738.1 quinolinate synthase [Lentisphaeria bacterium]